MGCVQTIREGAGGEECSLEKENDKAAERQNKSREKGTAGEKSRCQIAQEDSQDGAKKSSQQDESRVKEAQGKDKEGSKETEEGDCQGEEEDHQREEKIAQGASRRPG